MNSIDLLTPLALTTPEIVGLYNYWIVICLMMTGFYIVIARGNLIKTIIGLNIFQTSVFLLYVTMGKVNGGEAPILLDRHGVGHGHDDHGHGEHVGEHASRAIQAIDSTGDGVVRAIGTTDVAHGGVEPSAFEEEIAHAAGDAAHSAEHAAEVVFSNPLPSVLMLTAIVVGIATTALALALIVRIREDYGTIEEDEILELDRQAGE